MHTAATEMFGFRVGEVVKMLEQTMGEHEGEEFTFPAGTYGVISSIENYGEGQGWSFTIDIGGKITNVFDESDGLPNKKFFESTGIMLDRIRQPDFYTHAAFLDGEKDGNDAEMDDLRDLFNAAFAMLNDEQRFDLFFNSDVQDILDKSGVMDEDEED